MRNISLSIAAVIAGAFFALGACGPSGKQIATAKQARYQGDRAQLFAVIKAAVESKYKIIKSDEAAMGLQTDGRWYNPEGQAISATMGDVRDVPDQSINVSLVVELLPEGTNHVVAVKPVFLRYHKGRPNPDVLDVKDPSIPGWAHGKGDNLQVEIHDALKAYEVKAVPGAAPVAPVPAADPAAGSGTEPPAAPAAAPAAAP